MTDPSYRSALVKPELGAGWALFAEPEARLFNAQLFGTVFFGFASYINSGLIRSYCEIGRYCSIGRDVTVGLAHHDSTVLSTSPWFTFPSDRNEQRLAATDPVRRVIIGHDVWIGDGVRIMSGIRIGSGAIVGAGSIVTKNVEPYSVVAGSPARLIKERFDPFTRERLLASQWWDLDPQHLRSLATRDVHATLDALEGSDIPVFPQAYSRLTPTNSRVR